MIKLIKMSALAIFFSSASVFGAQSTAVQLERIATQDDGIVILYAKNGWGAVSNNNCSSGTGVLAFNTNTEGGKALLSISLAAHTAQKNIIVVTHDAACTPVGGMAPSIQRIDLLN